LNPRQRRAVSEEKPPWMAAEAAAAAESGNLFPNLTLYFHNSSVLHNKTK